MSDNRIENIFPHPSIRLQQQDAIDFILKKFSENKKYVILEAGTGVGKSAIAYTVSEFLRRHTLCNDQYTSGGNFLTTQKILQEQYERDFKKLGMNSVYSSSNYTCKFHKQNTCSESSRLLRTATKGDKFWNACMFNCPYKKAKSNFVDGNHGVTNFSYFLAETTYAGKTPKRNLLVIDEAHNIQNELSKFIEVSVSKRFCEGVLNLKFPKDLTTQKKTYDWIVGIYYPKILSMTSHIENMLEKYAGLKNKLQQFVKLAHRFEILDKYSCKLKRFVEVYHKDNWVSNNLIDDTGTVQKIEFKPIDVSYFAHDSLFVHGDKILMMSATILDKSGFCDMLGLKQSDVSFMRIDSPFESKNKPIFFHPIGKMSAKNIDQTLPLMAAAIKQILSSHKHEKGIIHCHSFKIANYLKRNIRNSRLLIHDSSNRNEVLKEHISSKKPTVLLSPSMTEGIDLKDDLSRFQVLCKIPYPYLGDKLVRKKMNKWNWWYPLETAKKIVQSTGRSIRNENDFAVTYILDADWDMFFSRNRHMFPKEFIECLV